MRRATSGQRWRWSLLALAPWMLVLVACDSNDRLEPSSASAPPVPPTTAAASTPSPRTTQVAPTARPTPTTAAAGPTTTPERSTDTTTGSTIDGGGRLTHPSGLVLTYPPGWSESGPSIATEFSVGSACAAVHVVDVEPPNDPNAAESGSTLASVVQICAQPNDSQDLEGFMTATYGGTDAFARTTLGGLPAYQAGDQLQTVFFVHDDGTTFEVLTSVVADVTLEPQRIHQIEEILRSVRFE